MRARLTPPIAELNSPQSAQEARPRVLCALRNVRRPPGCRPRRPRRPKPEGEIAVRTTGLLTAGRNPGDRTDPVYQLLTTDCNNATSEG